MKQKKNNIITNLFRQLKICLNYILIIFIPRNKKLIVFESFIGRQFSDNPRAIYYYIKYHYPDYICIWFYDKKHLSNFKKISNTELVQRGSFKWFWLIIRAKYWVSNSRFPGWLIKPKDTVYLQTWHGTPLKKLALDMEDVHIVGTDKSVYAKNFLKDANKWDLLIAPNKYSSDIFKRCFAFSKEMLNTGYPRNDILTTGNNSKTILGIKTTLNLPLDKKIVFYAPTWRDSYTFDVPFDTAKLLRELSDDFILMVRFHYQIKNRPDFSNYSGFIYDLTDYNEVNELYLISDILVTDYSSVFFDFSILKRPMIFYCFDIELYKNYLRGFYFDFEKRAPGPIVLNEDSLIKAIKESSTLTTKMLEDHYHDFYDQFTAWEDGNATKKVVNLLLNK